KAGVLLSACEARDDQRSQKEVLPPGVRTKKPSFGTAGSKKADKKAELCSQHSKKDMVNVVGRRCGHPGCTIYCRRLVKTAPRSRSFALSTRSRT
ncbi:unnamed protein product, partial [Ectocarpus sp. 6 AP-2014]